MNQGYCWPKGSSRACVIERSDAPHFAALPRSLPARFPAPRLMSDDRMPEPPGECAVRVHFEALALQTNTRRPAQWYKVGYTKASYPRLLKGAALLCDGRSGDGPAWAKGRRKAHFICGEIALDRRENPFNVLSTAMSSNIGTPNGFRMYPPAWPRGSCVSTSLVACTTAKDAANRACVHRLPVACRSGTDTDADAGADAPPVRRTRPSKLLIHCSRKRLPGRRILVRSTQWRWKMLSVSPKGGRGAGNYGRIRRRRARRANMGRQIPPKTAKV